MINRECGVYETTYQGDMAFFRVPLARWAISAILVLAIAIVPFIATEYWFSAIILPFLLFSIAVIGLNLLAGSCGQISLGHGAFMAVGGYHSDAHLYAGRALLIERTLWRHYGGTGRSALWHPIRPHQGPLSRDGNLGCPICPTLGH
ncbi:hypothetical protein KFU94_65235 [Chloroflexi bacterium TSY]|nr:hypothetical protein [Chloroflexi bacterium TSY]